MNNEIVHSYHGSPHVFDKFEWHNHGKESGSEGAGCGMYFSTSKTDALTYGENLYTCTLRLGRPLDNHSVTLTPFDIGEILKHLNVSATQTTVDKLLAKYSCDTDILFTLAKLYKPNVGELMDAVCAAGFTHTEDRETPDVPDMPHYIVYDLSRISIVDRMSIG